MKATAAEVTAEPVITFDKDDEDTLDFVAASANLRSIVFGIETKSRFDIKQMAGNIIPAIATTNAIVAGLCVLESFKVMDGKYDSTKEVSRDSVEIDSLDANMADLSLSVRPRKTPRIRSPSSAESGLPCL